MQLHLQCIGSIGSNSVLDWVIEMYMYLAIIAQMIFKRIYRWVIFSSLFVVDKCIKNVIGTESIKP